MSSTPAALRTPRAVLVPAILVALLSRASLVLLMPIGSESDMMARAGDEKYYFQIAHSLVDRGRFLEANLLAYRPPLYPAFLAVFVWLFGEHAAKALQITQNIAYLGVVMLIVRLAAREMTWRTRLAAAALSLALPLWISLPQTAYSETLFTLLFCAALFVQDRMIRLRATATSGVLLGVLSGGSTLTREIGLPLGLLLLLLLGLELRKRIGAAAAARICAVALTAFLMTVGVWTVRNYAVFGRFVPISTNGPINLYMGNNPAATGGMHWALPPRAQKIWNTPTTSGANEIEAAQLAGAGAIRYIEEHPARTASLWLQKLSQFWFPMPKQASGLGLRSLSQYARSGFYVIFTVLAVYGAWLHRRSPFARAVLGAVILGAVLHMATVFDLRYRAPFDVLLAVPCVWGVERLVAQLRRWMRRSTAEGCSDPALQQRRPEDGRDMAADHETALRDRCQTQR